MVKRKLNLSSDFLSKALKMLAMKHIENSTSLEIIYAKRKDEIVKKASELSILCDTDVAIIFFSPTGHLTSFAGKWRLV